MLDTITGSYDYGGNLGILVSTLLIPIVIARNKKAFTTKNDPFAKYIYCFIIFYIVEFLVTILSGAEFFTPAIKVIRRCFILSVYFPFKLIPLKSYKRFFKYSLFITVFQCLLFFLKLFGPKFLFRYSSGNLDTDFNIDLPFLLIPTIFFSYRSRIAKPVRYFLFAIFIAVVLFSGIRGLIISLLISFTYFLYKAESLRKKFPLLIILMLLYPLSSMMIEKKSKMGGVSAITDIKQVLSGKINADDFQHRSGNFSFRIAMLTERWKYLVENPQYLLTGVGTIHEDSPKCYKRFDFKLGTYNEGRYYERCLIESGDITWVPIVLRYGLLGVILHVWMFYMIFRYTHNRKDSLFLLTPTYIVLFLVSFDSSFFEDTSSLWLVALFWGIITRSRMTKN